MNKSNKIFVEIIKLKLIEGITVEAAAAAEGKTFTSTNFVDNKLNHQKSL